MLFITKQMKINRLNKIYIVLSITLVVATIIKILNYKGWERFYYFTSICAPQNYPIAIHDAYFLTGEGEDDFAWINFEDVKNFTSKWGEEYYSQEARDRLRLPTKLVLQYASYRDQKFYSDTLDLPQKKILNIFKSALKNKTAIAFSSGGGMVKKGLNFLVGIANDGNIIVWLRGVFLEKVIFKGKIKPHEPQGDETYFEKRLPKAAYLKKMFEDLPDSVKTKLNSGFDAKVNYIDSPTYYIEKNRKLWEYQKKNKYID
ncbi:hypothetical protein DF947_05745 [Pedobacter paludis]|uniref:DUF2931 domain-containing protein n=2 Tax=Pedobacter paludis TaxID=2203212 RepID=A0A317F3F8_9SPHI|nr:hypothetical protein DF947_05745 [Pedobacter paludis]